eukprot:CAMPEP_0194314886 /NCGR_PEP_ID=MMETSP0171-20130528/11692_1 /TAXON_ID=218684 /ORGANISM="Corethron pennatum, Strain L29A3" /LENGTH=81 /DNA_ID=CAMNT_0039070471 /DNA_START=36 /DNA_END=278 /DNA_ORIENTATION=-
MDFPAVPSGATRRAVSGAGAEAGPAKNEPSGEDPREYSREEPEDETWSTSAGALVLPASAGRGAAASALRAVRFAAGSLGP